MAIAGGEHVTFGHAFRNQTLRTGLARRAERLVTVGASPAFITNTAAVESTASPVAIASGKHVAAHSAVHVTSVLRTRAAKKCKHVSA